MKIIGTLFSVYIGCALYLAVVSMLFSGFFCLLGEGGGAHVRAVFLPLSPIVCLVDLSVKSFVYIFFFLFWIILCY